MESILFARVRITPARSDISEQEFSKAKADFTVGPYPFETIAGVQDDTNVEMRKFTFTPEITAAIRNAVDLYKKEHPCHLKYTYYITGVDFCTKYPDKPAKVEYCISMRTHLVGIMNSSVMYQVNHKKETTTA